MYLFKRRSLILSLSLSLSLSLCIAESELQPGGNCTLHCNCALHYLFITFGIGLKQWGREERGGGDSCKQKRQKCHSNKQYNCWEDCNKKGNEGIAMELPSVETTELPWKLSLMYIETTELLWKLSLM